MRGMNIPTKWLDNHIKLVVLITLLSKKSKNSLTEIMPNKYSYLLNSRYVVPSWPIVGNVPCSLLESRREKKKSHFYIHQKLRKISYVDIIEARKY